MSSRRSPAPRAGFGVLVGGILVGGTALANQAMPGLPAASWLERNPLPAFGLSLTGGFADGVNPCAITTLLLFVGALLATVERASHLEDARRAQRAVWLVAGAYILGIFALYLTLGVGFLEVSSIRVFGNAHLVSRIAALGAVLIGLAMVAESVYPQGPIRIGMPAGLHALAHRWTRRTSFGAAFVGGVLIGTCTIPCGGGMYLAIAALIGTLSNRTYAYGLLLSYNLAFVLPLALIVAVAGSRAALQRLSRLHITHRGQVKLGLGAFVIAVGLLGLALV